ncbi:MAG: hypothetical protein QM751_03670 [Paludibacteraceae bacterium]
MNTLIVLPMASLSNSDKEYLRETAANSNQTTDLYEENNTATDNLKLRDLDESFQRFFEDFTKDRKTQIALIKARLSVTSFNYETDEEEYMDKENLEKNWEFLDKDFFIETGLRNIEGLSRYGTWTINSREGSITYSNGVPETCESRSYIFAKVNGKWCLSGLRR